MGNVTEITLKGLDVRIDEMEVSRCDGIINEIATQTKHHLVGRSNCCRPVLGLFRAETTPDALRNKTDAIAGGVASVHEAEFGKTEMVNLRENPLLHRRVKRVRMFRWRSLLMRPNQRYQGKYGNLFP